MSVRFGMEGQSLPVLGTGGMHGVRGGMVVEQRGVREMSGDVQRGDGPFPCLRGVYPREVCAESGGSEVRMFLAL